MVIMLSRDTCEVVHRLYIKQILCIAEDLFYSYFTE